MPTDVTEKLDRSVIDGPNPEIIISTQKGARISYEGLSRLSALNLVEQKVKIEMKGKPIHVSVLPVATMLFSGEEREYGIGYSWRSVCTLASRGSMNESALGLLASAYRISKCWTGKGWII